MKHRPTNDRAASEVIGAILVFALAITALALIQMTVVPAWNQQTEFDHNDRVGSAMSQFSDDLDRAAATGTGGSRSLELGMEYQSRPFLYNPSSPAGSIQTGGQQQIILENVAADGPTGAYWSGETQYFTTTSVVYEPAYNEYQNAPTTVYEWPMLYNRFESVDVVVGGGQLIEDRQITLLTLDGELDYSATGFQSVEIVPISAPAQKIPVYAPAPDSNGDWEPIRLTIPSQLPVSEWEARFADQLYDETDPSSGNILSISSAGADAIQFELRPSDGDNQPVTYSLSMARLGIGTGYDRGAGSAHYLSTDGQRNTTVRPAQSQALTVEVRDRYNNPVIGERVTFDAEGGTLSADTAGSGEELVVRSDRSGKATVQHQRYSAGASTVEAVIGDGTADRERVVFTVVTTDPDERSPGEGTINQPSPLRLVNATAESVCKPKSDEGCTVRLTFTNIDETAPVEPITVEEARFAFYGSAGPGTSASDLPQALEFPVNSTSLDVRGEYQTVGSGEIAPGESWVVDLLFRDGFDERYEVQTSEFFVISVIALVDGTSANEFTYFVNPVGV